MPSGGRGSYFSRIGRLQSQTKISAGRGFLSHKTTFKPYSIGLKADFVKVVFLHFVF